MSETEEKKGRRAKREKPPKVKKEKPPKVKKEKPPKVKKEKPPKVKKEKPPKVKKEKPPKVKKEKPPRVKKEKPPKVKKAKKAAPEGEEGEGGGKKGGKKKLILILLPVVILVAAAAVFLGTRLLGRKNSTDAPPEETEISETAEGETEGGDEKEGGDASAEALAVPEPTQTLEIRTRMTTAEVVNYIESLPPAVLGLEGEDMSGYELFALESVILVDGKPCTQVRVYGDGAAGTNEIMGTYFLSRDGRQNLYRLDEDTNTVELLDKKIASVDQASGTVTLAGEEDAGDGDGGEAPDEEGEE